MKEAVLKAIEEERKSLERVHAEERELWKTEHAKDQEKASEALQTALQEQRKESQVTLSAFPWSCLSNKMGCWIFCVT